MKVLTDRSTRVCECGFVLPLLPPVGCLINNNGTAKVSARRETTSDYFCRSQTFCRLTRPCKQNKLGDPSALPGLSSRTHPTFIYLQVDDTQGLLLKRDKDESPSAAFRPSLKRQAASASLKVSPPAPSRQKSETQTDHSGGEQPEVVADATPFQTRSPLGNPGKSPTVPSAPCSDHTEVRIILSNR